MSQFDTVILMAHGRIVDYGTADALLARQPAMRELMQQSGALAVVLTRRCPGSGARRGPSRPTSSA
jgi:hypothetical protein